MSKCLCLRLNNTGFKTCCGPCSKNTGGHTSDCHERNGFCRCGRITEQGKNKCCDFCDGKLGFIDHSIGCQINHGFCYQPNCVAKATSSLNFPARIKHDWCTTCGYKYYYNYVS